MFVWGTWFCGAGELRHLAMEKYHIAKGIPEPKGCGGKLQGFTEEWCLGQKDEGQGHLRMAEQEQSKLGPIWQEAEQSHHRGPCGLAQKQENCSSERHSGEHSRLWCDVTLHSPLLATRLAYAYA